MSPSPLWRGVGVRHKKHFDLTLNIKVMFQKFIERPVLATVISILLVILGVLGLTRLPLQQFPDIAPPAVLVAAVYPGANAETVLRSVAPSLEEAINGVENMSYMSSTASNDGTLLSLFTLNRAPIRTRRR